MMGFFLKVFLLIIIVKLSFGAQDLMAVENSVSKIPAYIRELIQDFNKKDSNIHDVAILNLENESSEMILNQIVMEIPVENPTIIPDINVRLENRLRVASFIIIMANKYNMVELYNKGRKSFESNYFLNTAKFIFVATKPMSDADIYQVALLLFYIGAIHVVILNEHNDNLRIESLNTYLGKLGIRSLHYNTDIDYVYPHKLTSLPGFTYKALAFAQFPRLHKSTNGEYTGIDIKFMQTVAEKQNAKFNITIYLDFSGDESNFKEIINLKMLRKSVDITINTAIISTNKYTLKTLKNVNTFDVNGFCALVPNPPRTSFIGQMLTPFDFYTWILFVITIGTCVVIWKLFNLMGNGREDSALYFMYGVIAYFLLTTIPFRNNRIIQRSLLQICIFMMFILGNAYQSLIISLISESRYGATIKTFDELLQRNYSMKVDPIFYTLMNSTDLKKFHEINLVNSNIHDIDYKEEAANNTAIVLRCDLAEYIIYAKEYNSHAIDYFYLLPDQIYTFYESFPTCKFSPYYEKLQYYSTLIFESGIRQHWREFGKYEDIRGKIEINKITNEEYLINFDDLFGVFYLLGFGFICAILALIFEIFWHDCLRHLNCQMIHDSMTKKKEPKMVVRRIQVKPMKIIPEETSV